MKSNIWKKGQRYKLFIHALFIIGSLFYILPLILVISVSFSGEDAIVYGSGYSLIPQDFTLDAYKMAFGSGTTVLKAYALTAAESILGTFLVLLFAGMIAYSLSRSNFAYKGPITFIVFFTMLFSGGLIPTYIVYSSYYHLDNTFWIYILPGIAGGAWNTMMIRTFFKGIPESLFESARMDGASEFRTFAQIAVPLSKPVFATIGFMSLVSKWNNWNTSLVYIRNPDLYSLQYMLQKVLNDANFLKDMAENNMIASDMAEQAMQQPTETLKYALCVIAAGPMLAIFPLFQKYFVKGTTVGSVKG